MQTLFRLPMMWRYIKMTIRRNSRRGRRLTRLHAVRDEVQSALDGITKRGARIRVKARGDSRRAMPTSVPVGFPPVLPWPRGTDAVCRVSVRAPSRFGGDGETRYRMVAVAPNLTRYVHSDNTWMPDWTPTYQLMVSGDFTHDPTPADIAKFNAQLAWLGVKMPYWWW